MYDLLMKYNYTFATIPSLICDMYSNALDVYDLTWV